MSPDASCVPQLGPVELLLCLVWPLYIAQPFTPSEKASSRFVIDGLQIPILINWPLFMNISKQYLPPSVNIQVPMVVLKPFPYVDLAFKHSGSSLILWLVFLTSQQNRAWLISNYVHRNLPAYLSLFSHCPPFISYCSSRTNYYKHNSNTTSQHHNITTNYRPHLQ